MINNKNNMIKGKLTFVEVWDDLEEITQLEYDNDGDEDTHACLINKLYDDGILDEDGCLYSNNHQYETSDGVPYHVILTMHEKLYC